MFLAATCFQPASQLGRRQTAVKPNLFSGAYGEENKVSVLVFNITQSFSTDF